MELKNVDFYLQYIYSCNRCRSCTFTDDEHLLSLCPAYEMNDFFSFCGGGKAHIAQAIIEDKVKNFNQIKDYFFKCNLCLACKKMCPIGVDHYYLIRDVREVLFKKSSFREKILKIRKNILKKGNPGGEEKKEILDKVDINQKKVDYLFFVGCRAQYNRRENEIIRKTFDILKKGGISFGIMPDETCCGIILSDLGDADGFKRVARQNIKKFRKLKIKGIITSCAHCYSSYFNNYPEVQEFDFKIFHTTEIIKNLIEEDKLKIKNKIKERVTYHDPCRLSRHSEFTKIPRDLINKIGENFTEMKRRGERSYCCGGSLSVQEFYPDFQKYTSEVRWKEIKETQSDILLTLCPFCRDSFKDKNEIKTLDLVELIYQAIGGENEPGL